MDAVRLQIMVESCLAKLRVMYPMFKDSMERLEERAAKIDYNYTSFNDDIVYDLNAACGFLHLFLTRCGQPVNVHPIPPELCVPSAGFEPGVFGQSFASDLRIDDTPPAG